MQHDPGGKRTLPLMKGVVGDAAFSPCGRYRHALFREQANGLPGAESTALFVGMNPSTAGAAHDDPTCQREQRVAWRRRCRFYVKVNVMDYRATHPDDLIRPGVDPRSDTNLEWITRLAAKAAEGGGFAVAAWGVLKPAHRTYAAEALAALRASGLPIFCFGTTKDGSPKHPLYLSASTPLVPFEVAS